MTDTDRDESGGLTEAELADELERGSRHDELPQWWRRTLREAARRLRRGREVEGDTFGYGSDCPLGPHEDDEWACPHCGDPAPQPGEGGDGEFTRRMLREILRASRQHEPITLGTGHEEAIQDAIRRLRTDRPSTEGLDRDEAVDAIRGHLPATEYWNEDTTWMDVAEDIADDLLNRLRRNP